jgi:hypothetical protein
MYLPQLSTSTMLQLIVMTCQTAFCSMQGGHYNAPATNLYSRLARRRDEYASLRG